MARKLDVFPPRKASPHNYPWNEWCDGDPWEVMHGEDYFCDKHYFVNILYNHARTHGMKVRTTYGDVDGSGMVIFQFYRNVTIHFLTDDDCGTGEAGSGRQG